MRNIPPYECPFHPFSDQRSVWSDPQREYISCMFPEVTQQRTRPNIDTISRLLRRTGRDLVVSNTTAAAMWGLPVPPRLHDFEKIHVLASRTRSRVRRPNVVCHLGELDPEDYSEISGVPITSPARTIADISGLFRGTLSASEMSALLDAGFRCESPHASPQDLFVAAGTGFTRYLEKVLRRRQFSGRSLILHVTHMRHRSHTPCYSHNWMSYLGYQLSSQQSWGFWELRERKPYGFPAHAAHLRSPDEGIAILRPWHIDDSRDLALDRAKILEQCHQSRWQVYVPSFTDLIQYRQEPGGWAFFGRSVAGHACTVMFPRAAHRDIPPFPDSLSSQTSA